MLPDAPDAIGTRKQRDRCPLCGEANYCQSEMPQSCQKGACWCRSQSFPAALLAQLPEDEMAVRCICQNCLERFLK